MKDLKNETGLYVIDNEYRLINFNQSTKEMYPETEMGSLCYKVFGLKEGPCEKCPIRDGDIVFYNEVRKEWISANAADMEFPGYGECKCIHFRRRVSSGAGVRENIRTEEANKYIVDVKNSLGKECVIGSYCKPGSPIMFANDAVLELLGYDSMDEFMKKTDGLIMNLTHPEDKEKIRKDASKAQTQGDVYESSFRMLKADGSWVWIIGTGKIVETEDGNLATVTVCNDLSDFIRHTENLQRKNRETEFIMTGIPGGYHRCSVEEDYPFLYISDSFEKVVGWTKEEIATKFDNKFINLIWPEDSNLFGVLLEQIEEGGQGNSIYRIKHKDGGYRWVQDSTMYVDLGEDSFYQCTLADITSYIEELEKERERAQVSSRAKSTFLFNASHDIRTPMNAICGFTQMLKENPDDGQYVREMVSKIESSSDMLMKLLNDVLELSRIESGKEEVNLKAVNMPALGDRLESMFKQDILNAGIVFEREEHIQNYCVFCDELKIAQILMNMISNAKKFTPEGGKIVIGIEQFPCQKPGFGTYRIYVRDTGIGMSDEFQKRAFEQFERERTATDSGVVGSGLGMSIIRKLAELMNGICTLQSQQGKGTEIAVVLDLEITDGVRQKEELNGEIYPDLAGKRILLVEDNDFNREIARYVLQNLGMHVEDAENGSVAVSKLLSAGAGYYDLVLMDIQMPVMNGYVATAEIRRFPDTSISSIPIIAMTANAFQEDKERCKEAGMNGHISKPVEKDALIKEISRILA